MISDHLEECPFASTKTQIQNKHKPTSSSKTRPESESPEQLDAEGLCLQDDPVDVAIIAFGNDDTVRTHSIF